MSGERRLGFLFDPVPVWVRERWERGELSTERREILQALVGRANSERLAARQPTPEIRLESLAAAANRGADRRSLDALGRLVRRMREDGDLGFETRGVGSRTVYVFSLYPDGPRRSDLVPTSGGDAVPASDAPQHGSRSQDASGDERGRSDLVPGPERSGVPREPVSVPTSEGAASLHGQTDRGDPPSASVPTSSDVPEKIKNPLRTEDLQEASALGVARAREDDPLDWLPTDDAQEQLFAPPHPGAYGGGV